MKRREFLSRVGWTLGTAPVWFPFVSRLASLSRDGSWVRLENNLWVFDEPKVQVAGCTILNRNIGGVDDKRIVLANGQFARLLPSGISWDKIRVAIRYTFNATASISGTPRFWFGLCSGTTNQVLDAATTNFFGCVSNTTTWTYYAASGISMAYFGVTTYPMKRVGTTNTQMSSFTCYHPASGTSVRRVFIGDITRGSPNYSFTPFGTSNTGNNNTVDITQDLFLQIAAMPIPSYSQHANLGNFSGACDEVPGAFDAVNIGWDQTVAQLEICDLAITKLA